MATHQQHSHFSPTADPEEPGESRQTGQLWVEIEIKEMVRESCPVAKHGNSEAAGEVQLTGDRCHVSLESEWSESSNAGLFTTTIEEQCACTAACASGITPSNLRIENGDLVLNAFVDSRDRLHHLSDQLEETAEEWHLRKLMPQTEYSRMDRPGEKGLSEEISLTDKQREVVRLAVNQGYYANPRRITLGELADEVGVTKAAVSQRLNAVEAKLIDELAAEL